MPLRYLLDTGVVSDLLRNPRGVVADRVASVGASQSRHGDRGLRSYSVSGRVKMSDTSICGLGQAAANPLNSVLRHFREDVGLGKA